MAGAGERGLLFWLAGALTFFSRPGFESDRTGLFVCLLTLHSTITVPLPQPSLPLAFASSPHVSPQSLFIPAKFNVVVVCLSRLKLFSWLCVQPFLVQRAGNVNGVVCLPSLCAGHGILGMNMPLCTVHHPFCPHPDTGALRLNSARAKNAPLSCS